MAKKLLLSELDKHLTEAASRASSYDRNMGAFASQCDREGLSLERADPDSWRRSPDPVKLSRGNSLEQLFRAEVASILTLGRDEEAVLARRVEFARLRL